jgi:phage tail-like protein
MQARDANNATWYMLRYATDFAPRPPSALDPAGPQFVPASAPALFYDDSRHVLELLPVKPAQALAALPGLAVDLSGELYRVDPASLLLLRRYCDGTEVRLLCEPGILRAPAGLALDRRGFLYVADPLLARVIVLRPEDGSAVAILAGELRQPTDVAVAPDGRIYVADPALGRIFVYDAGFRAAGSFASQGVAPLPAAPQPVAVMIDADGTILVADANYPWLLRFGPQGAPLGDVALATLLAPLVAEGISLADPLALLAGPPARFIAGACRPPYAADDIGVRLATIHRCLRLLALKLSHSFRPTGVVLSAALDGLLPGTIWHKIVLEADLPPGTWITVETATSDSIAALVSTLGGTAAGDDLAWSAPLHAGAPIGFTRQVPDQLVQSGPGRFLRLRITLGSDGQATPGLHWLKVLFPRVSYLDALPRVYQRDADAALFLQRFLGLFERVLTGVEDRYEQFSRWLDPRAAPLEIINWLGLLVDLTFDPSWPLARRRALVGAAMALYRTRGTIAGLRRYVEIYTGTAPVIREMFLERPGQPAFLGIGGSVLGAGFALAPPGPANSPQAAMPGAGLHGAGLHGAGMPTTALSGAGLHGAGGSGAGFGPTGSSGAGSPDAGLIAAYAHRFTVLVYPEDACEAETLLPVVDRIVTLNKPAHTIHRLVAVYPDARVGLQDTIGVDLVVGGGVPALPGGGGLGVDSVLRDGRPPYGPPGLALP